MGRGLGPFQREVLQRIGREIATNGEVRVGEIAPSIGHVRGFVSIVTDNDGTDHRIDMAHQLGLRHALAALERRGLIWRHKGWLELTEAGAAIVGDCPPLTHADHSAEVQAARDAFRRRKAAAIAAGCLKPNGSRWI